MFNIWYNNVEKARKREENGMSICKLTLTTSVDGKENRAQYMGKLEREAGDIRLYYREENAEISLLLRKKTVVVKRVGDYSLQLCLRQGEDTEGSLSIGDSAGKILTETYLVDCEERENEVRIVLHYALIFDGDKQDMRLCVTANTRGKK